MSRTIFPILPQLSILELLQEKTDISHSKAGPSKIILLPIQSLKNFSPSSGFENIGFRYRLTSTTISRQLV